MPPASADLATTWQYLEEGVDHIMTKLQTGVSYSKVSSHHSLQLKRLVLTSDAQYMSLYTVAYNYCTSSKMHGSEGGIGLGGKCMSSTGLTYSSSS